ncbi:sensor histidine kinase [Halioxenophilus aromaticivorans]|uniref:histidine kinase n=1 Tax=Halioxenophilus aromaticivorans TaxID=1306992 RepID=A0AAV3U330_9ALTE
MPQRGRKYIRVWAGTIGVALVLLFLNALQSYQAFSNLAENESDASLTKSVLRTIKDFYAAVQDAELGMRGFFVSGDEMYLDGYFFAVNEINLHLTQLKQYPSLLGQRENITTLERLVIARLKATALHIEKKERKPDSLPLAERWMQQSYTSMTEISSLVSAMESAEYAHLAEQSQKAAASARHLRSTMIIANIVGLALIVLVAVQVYRALVRHRQENDRLENMVQTRTEELQHYSNELQRSNRELQDFAFVASHDLQEPLRKIQAFGGRIKTIYQGKLGDKEDYIDRMQAAAERMSRLIDDLLAFSRVSTRKEPFIEVDLNQVLADVTELLELKIQETHTAVSIDSLPTIDADPSQMRQLFQNLLTNAIKFVSPGQTPAISISCDTTDDEQTVIRIKDNGIGIEPQYLEKIFTPFQRLHGRDRYEGNGIGLAICRRIVERHQGSIEIHSEPSLGSTFVITLPTKIKEPLWGNDDALTFQESEDE